MNKKKTIAPNSMDDRNRLALAYLELAKDKIFKKLSAEQKHNLIKEVLAIGDEVGGWIKNEYNTSDPRKIAAHIGVRVLGENCFRNKNQASQYRKLKKEIVICRNFHEKLVREIQSKELSENLLKFLVAHELFHHLEAERIGQVYKRFPFKVWKLGPFTREKYIKGLSNVAAQAFTLNLLGMKISPQVFDYLAYMLYTNQ